MEEQMSHGGRISGLQGDLKAVLPLEDEGAALFPPWPQCRLTVEVTMCPCLVSS